MQLTIAEKVKQDRSFHPVADCDT